MNGRISGGGGGGGGGDSSGDGLGIRHSGCPQRHSCSFGRPLLPGAGWEVIVIVAQVEAAGSSGSSSITQKSMWDVQVLPNINPS